MTVDSWQYDGGNSEWDTVLRGVLTCKCRDTMASDAATGQQNKNKKRREH